MSVSLHPTSGGRLFSRSAEGGSNPVAATARKVTCKWARSNVDLSLAVDERVSRAKVADRPMVPAWATYGVEMELCYPCDMEAVQKDFEGAEGAPGWNTKVDVSVKCRPPCKACEVNSPILSGTDGLLSVRSACDTAARLYCRTCKTGAVHVHVGIQEGGGAWELQHLKQLAINFCAFEPLIDRLVPPSRRFDQNLYAKSLCRLFPSFQDAACAINEVQSVDQLIETVNPGTDPDKEGRRYKLNFRALHKYNTVEWRLFGGSANASKITGCVLLASWFIHRSRSAIASSPQMYNPQLQYSSQGSCVALVEFLKPECCDELLEWIPFRARELEQQEQNNGSMHTGPQLKQE